MKTIRASDIGMYSYCQRAWWYHDNGIESENIDDLSVGTMLHEEHGKVVLTSGCLRTLAFGFFFLSLSILTLYLLQQVLDL